MKKIIYYILFCVIISFEGVWGLATQVLILDKYEFQAMGASATDARFCAPSESKFKIIDSTDTHYYIQFRSIATFSTANQSCTVVVEKSKAYQIAKAALAPKFHMGLAHGPLTVPFRVQFDGTISPGGGLGYFVGWRFLTHSILFATGGLGAVNAVNYPDTKEETKVSIIAAVGYAYDLGQAMHESLSGLQLGIVVGIDHANGYKYNDRLWASFSVGYGFTN